MSIGTMHIIVCKILMAGRVYNMINNSIATALLSFVLRIFNSILSYNLIKKKDNINLITYLNLDNLYLLAFNNFIGGKKRWDI